MCISKSRGKSAPRWSCEELVGTSFPEDQYYVHCSLKKDIAWYNEIYPNDPKTNHDFKNDPQQNGWPSLTG